MRVDEHTIELASVPAFYRAAPATGAPPVYLHGLPTSSDDWEPALERTGGIAPDLIGFGRSAKGGNLDYTIAGLADFVAALLGELDIAGLRLVGHDWGALVALELVARAPERVERLALVAPVPLTAGHAWSRLARAWRLPGVGELAMGSVSRSLLARHLRAACADPDAVWPKPRLDAAWRYFDQGTQRAILRLHRSTAADHLMSMTTALEPVSVPVLVMGGEGDPHLTAAHARAVAELLPRAELVEIAQAGHWPWLERADALEALTSFVGSPE